MDCLSSWGLHPPYFHIHPYNQPVSFEVIRGNVCYLQRHTLTTPGHHLNTSRQKQTRCVCVCAKVDILRSNPGRKQHNPCGNKGEWKQFSSDDLNPSGQRDCHSSALLVNGKTTHSFIQQILNEYVFWDPHTVLDSREYNGNQTQAQTSIVESIV